MEQRPQITDSAMMNYSNLGLMVTANGDLANARTLIDPAGIHIIESDLSDVKLIADMQATIAAQAALIKSLNTKVSLISGDMAGLSDSISDASDVSQALDDRISQLEVWQKQQQEGKK